MHTRRRLLGLACLGAATLAWLPALHLFFPPAPDGRALAARQLAVWHDPEARAGEIAAMRVANAEWDFMGRSFVAWSLAEVALADPVEKPRALAAIDRILDETLRLERERGPYFFLLPYAHDRAWVNGERSQFLDGEIALMLALRCLVEERADYHALLRERVALMAERMRKSPVLSAESYPDECWTFCNAIALAALRVSDRLDGTHAHAPLLAAWLEAARQKLIDPKTGLLVSSYTVDGQPLDGPEGSTIWMVAHCLRLVDEGFAREQYERARRELGRGLYGFAWAGEWPRSWRGPTDIDSGPIVPLVGASPSASGFAFVGAASFGDRDFGRGLAASLGLAAMPLVDRHGLRYAGAPQVGNAVLLYASVLGPAWKRVLE